MTISGDATIPSDTTHPGSRCGRGPGRSRRLVLREFDEGDIADLAAMHADPRLRALLIDDHPLDRRYVCRCFVERIGRLYRADEGLGIWHAARSGPPSVDAPSFVGWFSLMRMGAWPERIEIGSRLRPAAWGGGLAIEGGALLLDHAFGTLGLAEVWATCHPDNRSARAVLAALGFADLGEQPYDGRPARHHRLRLNAWRAARDIPVATRLRRALRAREAGHRDLREACHE